MTTKMTKPKHTHPWMNTDIRRKINQKHRAHVVKTDLNCSLRILALLWLSLFRNPCWFFSGATPINSWPLLLMYDHSLLVLSLSHITSVMYFLPAFLISFKQS
jgi:hypothetical protein